MKVATKRKEVGKIGTLRKTRRKVKAIVIAASCLCAAILVVLLLNYDKLIVHNIDVKGTSLVPSERIMQYVGRLSAGKYMYLIPKSSTIFFPKEAVANAIMADFPPVEEVKIERSGLGGMVISVKEREANYLWCGNTPNPDDVCFYIDEKGYIFKKARAPIPSGLLTVYAKTNKETSSVDGVVGSTVLTPEIFSTIIQVVKIANEAGLNIEKLVVTPTEADLYTGNGWPIYLPIDKKLLDSPLIFQAAIKSKPFTTDNIYEQIEYLDLRYGNKVYFKRK